MNKVHASDVEGWGFPIREFCQDPINTMYTVAQQCARDEGGGTETEMEYLQESSEALFGLDFYDAEETITKDNIELV